jgi:hypothetical protein
MSQSNRFNYSNKQRYVNNQHIICKLNTRTIYKKEDYYKDNHRTIIPTNIDKPSKLKISPRFKSKLNCSICLKSIKSNSSTLKCNHIFHLGCINEWIKVSNTCPICRAVIIPGKDIVPTIVYYTNSYGRLVEQFMPTIYLQSG